MVDSLTHVLRKADWLAPEVMVRWTEALGVPEASVLSWSSHVIQVRKDANPSLPMAL